MPYKEGEGRQGPRIRIRVCFREEKERPLWLCKVGGTGYQERGWEHLESWIFV